MTEPPPSKPMVDQWGGITWRNAEGHLHRDDDKPAAIYQSGKIAYYKNDEYHREGDQPAVIMPNKHLFFFKYGRLHRFGGKPAVIKGSYKAYYNNGNEYFPCK